MEDRPLADQPSPAPEAVFGARWAMILGAVLLVIFAALAATRWFSKPASANEQIVQIPVVAASPTPTPAVLAPDPGDTP